MAVPAPQPLPAKSTPVMETCLGSIPAVSGVGAGAAALRPARKPRMRAETEYFIAKVLRRYEL